VYEPGKAALLRDPSVVKSLEQLVGQAMTDEAKDFAHAALVALGVAKAAATPQQSLGTDGGAMPLSAPYVMASYNWDHQQVILRVVGSLQARGYLVWIDTEQMKGATVDTMALAVEGSELMLIGMSRQYKESSNCRMEAQYALQKKKPFIPLKLTRGYEADGWLGLLLGTSMYYAFYGDTLASESAFETLMESLCREIGDRGRPDVAVVSEPEPELAVPIARHAELRALKLSVLKKQASASGVSEVDIEEAHDADDIKAAVIDLIVNAETEAQAGDAAILEELQGLKLGELRKRAKVAEIDAAKLEDAMDEDEPEAAVIALLLLVASHHHQASDTNCGDGATTAASPDQHRTGGARVQANGCGCVA
jgi:hypothetical protein